MRVPGKLTFKMLRKNEEFDWICVWNIFPAYSNCVNEPFCAARAIQAYMGKFGQDCNADGVTNCIDYAAIHKHGGYGCNAPLPVDYQRKFDDCINYALTQG